MQPKEDVVANISLLKVSPAIQKGLREFVSQVIDSQTGNLISIIAFGSAVTGDYDTAESDVNLLIVYSDLTIADLERVAEPSRHWLNKQKFAPRFLTRRNLDQSMRYFQVDYLAMRDARVVLWGEDVLASFEVHPAALRWQIAYEIKAMRMRIKQQFWRTAGDPRRMRAVLVERFTSLVHLMRALLVLNNLPAPITRRGIIDAAVEHLDLNRAFADQMLNLRQSQELPRSSALVGLFNRLMEAIRAIDSRVEDVKL